jgi:hypothetical protein
VIAGSLNFSSAEKQQVHCFLKSQIEYQEKLLTFKAELAADLLKGTLSNT